jgi:hypothetical protein
MWSIKIMGNIYHLMQELMKKRERDDSDIITDVISGACSTSSWSNST